MSKNIKRPIFIGFFTALICIGAYIRIPMVPVPVTMQSFFVMLAGIILGARDGALAVLVYIILGLCGLPLFSGGGGIQYMIHPTFGFLAGFLVCTFCVGSLCKKENIRVLKLFIYLLISLIPIYITGGIYFYFVTKNILGADINLVTVIYSCCLVFVPGDILKCVLCAVFGKRVRRLMRFAIF